MADLRRSTARACTAAVALTGALAGAVRAAGAQTTPVDTSWWSADTRRLWHEARALQERRDGRAPARAAADSARVANATLVTVSVPGFTLRVPPAWAPAAEQALRAVQPALTAAQPLPPQRAVALPRAAWTAEAGEMDRPYIVWRDPEPVMVLPSQVPDADALTRLVDRQVTVAVQAALASTARAGRRVVGTSIAEQLDGVTGISAAGLHLRAATALRSGGREGWRLCAAGDATWCARVLAPTAEDSASGFLGARDHRARVLADTFPLEIGQKRQCLAGDDAACAAWVKRFDLAPGVQPPKEVNFSVAVLAAQYRRDALARLRTNGAVPFGTAAAMVAGISEEEFARVWRDSLVAAQRRSHADDGRMALLAAPWLAVFGLIALGGRRDAR